MKFDLQLFAEKNLENQTSNQLRKGIRSLQKEIDEHLVKIKEPWKIYADWYERPDKQAGRIGHWLHEIKNFNESIQNCVKELEKRGEKT